MRQGIVSAARAALRAKAHRAEPAQPAQQLGIPGRGGRELLDTEQPADRAERSRDMHLAPDPEGLTTSDDHEALATMANSGGGIYRLGPAMSSVILAACRPDRFTVADSRALSTLRALGRTPPGPPGFRINDWPPYLDACQILAPQGGLSLRQVDRALWAGASDPRIAHADRPDLLR
jgi:hypothetical protein